MKLRIDTRPNPFEFGTEFAPERLVDREEEIELVVRTAINRGRLFLIGPRRLQRTAAGTRLLGTTAYAPPIVLD